MSTEDAAEYISNLTHEDPKVRKSAAIALGEIGDPHSYLSALWSAYYHENEEDVRKAIGEAGGKCHENLDQNLCWYSFSGQPIGGTPYMRVWKYIPKPIEDREEWLEEVRHCRNIPTIWENTRVCDHGKWAEKT